MRTAECTKAAIGLLLVLFVPLLASAQPAFVHPALQQSQGQYGGQLVAAISPDHAGTIVLSGDPTQTPIFLDQMPEFCNVDHYSGEPVLLELTDQVESDRLPPGARKGVFQKLFFTGVYLPQFDDDSLGFTEFEAGVVLGFPFIRRTTPLLVTPRFAVHYLDRPTAPDLPAQLYDAEVTFRHLRKFGNGPWAMNAAVTLGEYSDFESSDADAFRVTGQAFVVYESSSTAQWVFGIVYLNRQDISLVPAGGVIYQLSPYVTIEAILPRPRVVWRIPDGLFGGERWAYVGGEFGSGVWSIERPATNTHDLLYYRDYRILAGVETKRTGGINHRLEVGYVFGRELEFASATPDVRLDDSLFVRGGITY